MTLSLVDVTRYFSDGDHTVAAVDGVSMTVRRGELVALYGPSGSGKTTLLLLCAGLETPDLGSVTWDGQTISGCRGRERSDWLRDTLGLIPQRVQVEPGLTTLETATEKLLGGSQVRPSNARRAMTGMLSTLGLAERLEHPIERLSGGERQRVAIARALSTDPALVLADEPTGNLDSERTGQVLNLLRDVAERDRRAVLLVTHDPRAADIAHRTLTLRDGRLVDTEPQAPLPRARLHERARR